MDLHNYMRMKYIDDYFIVSSARIRNFLVNNNVCKSMVFLIFTQIKKLIRYDDNFYEIQYHKYLVKGRIALE